MTRIKLCGLTRPCDIEAANELMPEYIGFVFAKKSRRYVSPEGAAALKARLNPAIQAVGVFVNAPVEFIAQLLAKGVIDVAQLHGSEDAAYIENLRALTDKPIIQAFRVSDAADLERARASAADDILLDNGAGGTGAAFDWALVGEMDRPYFLAGGLSPKNAGEAVKALRPFAVDVSSGIETDGLKDPDKMRAFVAAVRAADGKEDVK
ncbi:MAG: phosphoribosylanthranilate isomerase [Clostridia bacterium]|nr:phosphoribosylanthranilate isomerase [Clostridia bacterium]